MKKSVTMILSAITLTMFLSLQAAFAQDARVAGVTKKLLFENDQVKVYEVEFMPGATDDWHSHPHHITYAMTDVKIEVMEEGKDPVVREMKAGEAKWNPPTKHKVINLGKEKIKALVTELKQVHQH